MSWRATSAIVLLTVAASAAGGVPLFACQDTDGDGYYNEPNCGTLKDCNDASSVVHPGAPEICDGYDSDCDGALDDDPACDTACDEPDALGDLLLLSDVGEQTAVVWTGSEYGVAYSAWPAELYFVRIDAAGQKIGSGLLVTNAGGWTDEPSLAWTGSEYGVAWRDHRDGSYEIYFARFDAAGSKVGSDVRVTDYVEASGLPSVVWTGGEYGIAWTRDLNDEAIYFTRLDGSGTKIGTDVLVTDANGRSSRPRLVWTGSEYGLAWSDSRDGNWEIYFARLDVSGNKIGADVRLTDSSDFSGRHSLVWSGSDYGIAWWEHSGPAIVFGRIDAGGNKIGSDIQLTNGGEYVSLVWTGSEYGVFWQDRGANGMYQVHLTRTDPMGNRIGNDVLLTEFLGPDLFAVRTGNGYAVAGTTHFTRVGCDCSDFDLDGVSECQDCDDQNASVYPNAPEQCDGVSNDCRDPNWPIPPDHADTDADGFTPCDGDCDDAANVVFPGAAQICDGVNNDCDDPAWPAIPEAETDVDGDSFSECQGDCDDSNPNVNPLAVEVCNQIDDDCNHLVDENEQGVDTDGDRVRNACDNCLVDRNLSQADLDADGVGDRCDLDDGRIYMWFDEPAYVRWQAETNYSSWNSYRGDLELLQRDGALACTQDPSRVPLAARNCDLTTPWVVDDDPPAGAAVFFLTTGNDVETGTESSLDADSSGVERINRFPCP